MSANAKVWSGRYFMVIAFGLTACAVALYVTVATGECPEWFDNTLTAIVAYYFGQRSVGVATPPQNEVDATQPTAHTP